MQNDCQKARVLTRINKEGILRFCVLACGKRGIARKDKVNYDIVMYTTIFEKAQSYDETNYHLEFTQDSTQFLKPVNIPSMEAWVRMSALALVENSSLVPSLVKR